MTAAAVMPQAAPAPVKVVVPQQAKPKAAAATPRPRPVPLKPMRREAAGLMRKLAVSVQQSHPGMNVHDHLRDAAKALEAENEEGAQRHLRAAFFSLTPQSLHRNGLFTDDAHTGARQAMHAVHRHIMLVKDIADADAKNQAAIRRDSGDGAAVPPPRPDPNAGYGPGANAQKPTVRQPPGDQALNAPATSDGGGSDPSTADPGGPQAKGPKQLSYDWRDVSAAIEMTGPGGWDHNWRYVGGPGLPSVAEHRSARNAARRKNPPAAGRPAAKAPAPAARAAPAKEAEAPDGHRLADRLNMTGASAGKRAQKQAVRALPVAHLKAMDAEYARRATLLGQHGKVSPTHKLVRDEIASRAKGATVQTAYDWRDLLNFIELSAKTSALEQTPALYGKPGGPGLYGVAGNKHSDYYEQVVKGLMTKRGMDKGQASAIAWGVLRKWAHGGGGVHPEVAAAASKALAQESAASAKAHAHAGSWDDVLRVLDFGLVPGEPRVPAGSATAGQFSAGAAAQPAAGQQPAKAPPAQTAKQKAAAAAAAKAKAASDAHKAHVAHVAHTLKVSTGKAGLLVSADDDRKQAQALIAKRNLLAKALASASGKTSTGQAGSKTSTTATTKTTAPAVASSTSAAAPAASATAGAATAKKATAAAPAASAKAGSAAQVKAQIASLNTQINGLLAAAATATAQASKMK
jgi:hypothetical protein